MDIDLSTIIVAVIGAIATVYGIREASRGRKDTAAQQQAANRLAADQLELEEHRAMRDDLRLEADRAYRARDHERTEAELWRSRSIEAETALRLAEEQMRRALSDVAALRMIVLDEVARAASDDAWGTPGPPR